MHNLFKKLLIFLLVLGFLVKPQPVSAEFLEITSPAEIYQDSAFEIEVKVSAQPSSNYKIKARLGQTGSQLTKAQTFEETNGVWLSDTVNWDKFPSLQTNSDGSWVGKLKVKPAPTASLGSNILLIRIHHSDNNSNYDSPTYSVTLLKSEQTQPVNFEPPKLEGKPTLSEFMAQPTDKTEWVELRNDGDTPADISGWKIDDEEGKSSPAVIPDNTILPSRSYFVLNFSSFKLNDLADSVRLLKPDNSVVDNFTYEKTVRGQSWSKDNNGNWFITSDPTPNTENKFTYISETPNPAAAPNQKPVTSQTGAVLTENTAVPTVKAPLPALGKSNKIATVSSSFASKQGKGSFSNLVLFIAGALLIISAFAVLLKNNLKRIFSIKKAAVPIKQNRL